MYEELATIQSPASRTKIGQAKKPQAECLDRRELTKKSVWAELEVEFYSELPTMAVPEE